ncbi:winged helix-turn-helix domain-containing protein [Plantactinospora sp. BB1]|uniref:winged helix-turn-helix domain-containing protein n=1 Tax=Plantactinospora sp. BB1 TaxID=2071627 RepID=UPI000D17E2D5|nr:winged helix-turn-helix domain-containing protein [Plantactinospora sp. BB1]AVT38172.1 transcriptional regulator [Plantactinospora sp. BB1]
MSVVAIHPRTPSPAGPRRAPSARRRSPAVETASAVETAPVIRVTVDLPLVGGRVTEELALLLGLVRQLRDQGADVVTETRLPGRAATDPGLPGLPDSLLPDLPEPLRPGAGLPAASLPGVGLPEPLPTAAGAAAATGPDDADSLRVLTGPRVVLQGGRPVPFTRLEFDLLVFLARNPRRVFTRLQLLGNVWGYEHAVARTVDVHVRRLRAKVHPSMPLVTTVHGVGYRLADDAPVRIDDLT